MCFEFCPYLHHKITQLLNCHFFLPNRVLDSLSMDEEEINEVADEEDDEPVSVEDVESCCCLSLASRSLSRLARVLDGKRSKHFLHTGFESRS